MFEPVTMSLCRLRLKNMTPSDPMRDPYIACILIALAQCQQRAELERACESEDDDDYEPVESYTVCQVDKLGYYFIASCTLLTMAQARVLYSTTDIHNVYVYTATISSAFLNKLDCPSLPSNGPTPVPISITSVPLRPFSTLRDRLFAILLPPTQSGPKDNSCNNSCNETNNIEEVQN